jgi:hypothetical protein
MARVGAVAGAAALPATTTAAAGPRASDVQVAFGSMNNPITLDRIDELRRASVEEHVDRGGDLEAAPAKATPDIPDPEAEIVAYAYMIDAAGHGHHYTGIAGDDASVDIVHDKARTKVSDLRTTTTSTQEVSTSSTPSWGDAIDHGTDDFYKDPYGGVTNNWDLWKLKDDTDAYDDAFCIKHIFAMEPGYQAYDSEWENHYGRAKQKWTAGEHGGEELHDWDPMGTNDGSQTVGVSVSADGVANTWQYTQDAVTTYDESSTNDERAQWKLEFNTSDSRKYTQGFKPGSTAWVNEQYDGAGWVDLLDTVSFGDFIDYGWWGDDTYYLKHTWHVSVYY